MSDISKEMTVKVAPEGFSGAEYNKVARGAELEGIILMNSSFDVKAECISDQRDWKLSHGRKILSCQFNEEERSVAAVLEYNVTARLGRKRALRCVTQYAVFYETPAGATKAGAIGFCRNVGTFAAYPYFRALFSRLSSEANLRLPPLPAIASMAHIPPKKSKEAKKVKTGDQK